MSDIANLIDCLRYRPVATTAAQMRTAASEIERLQAEVTRLMAEQDAISAAIGTNEYMDPPDGGNVSLAEQVRRMRDALRAKVARLTDDQERGTCALCVAFGEELWRMGHPAFVVVHLREEFEKAMHLWKSACTERDALLARVAAAEQDAARYRWLRNESLHRLIRGPICIDADTWGEPVMACGKHITLDGATLDAAIDAAQKEGM